MNVIKGQSVILVEKYRNSPARVCERKIESIGKKYFTLVDDRNRKYYIESGKPKETFSDECKVYATITEYENELEHQQLSYKIYQAFQYSYGRSKYSLEQLRAIDKIISHNPLIETP